MLEIVPINFNEACEFVRLYHRHHKPPIGHKFSIGCSDGSAIVGVAMVGRPVSRHLDDGWTLEVNRLATNGTKNACSKLYGAVRRATVSLGYKRLITYILDTENGVSLSASGWKLIGMRGGGSWDVPSRPRVDTHPTQRKLLYEAQIK